MRRAMSPRLRGLLRRRWACDVLALTFAGSITLAVFLLGGLTFVSTLAVVCVSVTPIALIAATLALKPTTLALKPTTLALKPTTRALEAAPDKDPDE